jgi:uncharacterized protein YqjF (DUF2071 family)
MILTMRWHELAFLHWRVEAAALIPAGLEIDEHDGSAWIAVVPFHMTGVGLRGLPPPGPLSAFPELNVRTYVRTPGGKPGVWFFSLDAMQRVIVRFTRTFLHLAYLDARMEHRRDGEWIRYASRRTHLGAGPAELEVRYRPVGPAAATAPGALDHFLTARYCLYAAPASGRLRRMDIEHEPWLLQPGEAEIGRNTMTRPLGIALEGTPLVHYVARMDVRAGVPRRV